MPVSLLAVDVFVFLLSAVGLVVLGADSVVASWRRRRFSRRLARLTNFFARRIDLTLRDVSATHEDDEDEEPTTAPAPLVMDEDAMKSLRSRVEVLMARQQYAAAEKICIEALAHAEDDFMIRRLLADCYLGQERWNKAELLLAQLADEAASEAEHRHVLTGLAEAQRMQGNVDAALATYQRIFAHDLETPDILRELALTFVDAGEHDRAIIIVDELHEDRPADIPLLELGVMLANQLQDESKELFYLERLNHYMPRRTDVRERLQQLRPGR